MASPAEFIRQVKLEASKVTWPSRKETGMAGLMILVMVTIFGLFFAATDFAVSQGVKALLGL
jgi:preprotein translocase subunit SecE